MKKGFTLLELMVATTILSIGIIGLGVLFPAGLRSSMFTRQNTQAIEYCQQELERLRVLSYDSGELDGGAHPEETLNAKYVRNYVITEDYPVEGMKKIEVNVSWVQSVASGKEHSQSIMTYITSR